MKMIYNKTSIPVLVTDGLIVEPKSSVCVNDSIITDHLINLERKDIIIITSIIEPKINRKKVKESEKESD